MDRVAQLQAFLERKPTDRFALYSLALELKKAGDVAGAQQLFDRLLQAHPTSGAGHYQHGLLHYDLDELDAARAAWTSGLQALEGQTDAEARRSISEIQGMLDLLD
ncbi:MAG: hypothetical protein KTR31_28535 [Myxococcales bacterium]|nr:hypothetical protein [Myxococcales bacterium]